MNGITKEQLKIESDKLILCPFCNGKAEFSLMNDEQRLHIHHYPEAGVCCPARMDQYCDNFEQGQNWWNTRK